MSESEQSSASGIREQALPLASDLSPEARLTILSVVEARRSAINTLAWQVPALTLTAQAFLLSLAAAPATTGAGRLFAAGIGLVTVLATLQLFARHHRFEIRLAHWLELFEQAVGLPLVSKRDAQDEALLQGVVMRKAPEVACGGRWIGEHRSVAIWLWTLWGVFVADLALVILAILQLTGVCHPLAGPTTS
jgi:hypothetical protein